MNKLSKALLAILLIGGAAVVAVTLTIDGMVKSAIEEQSSALFQTEVTIDALDISIFGGSSEIEGFVINNPEGFSDNEAVRFSQVNMQVDLASLFSDRVIVNEVVIAKSLLYFEQRGVGANLNKLKRNMELAEVDEDQKAVVIKHFIMNNARVKVSTDIERERNAEVSIDQIVLNDIGAEGSNTLKQTLQQVMEPILQRTITEAIKSGVIDQLENKVKDLIQGQ